MQNNLGILGVVFVNFLVLDCKFSTKVVEPNVHLRGCLFFFFFETKEKQDTNSERRMPQV